MRLPIAADIEMDRRRLLQDRHEHRIVFAVVTRRNIVRLIARSRTTRHRRNRWHLNTVA